MQDSFLDGHYQTFSFWELCGYCSEGPKESVEIAVFTLINKIVSTGLVIHKDEDSTLIRMITQKQGRL